MRKESNYINDIPVKTILLFRVDNANKFWKTLGYLMNGEGVKPPEGIIYNSDSLPTTSY